MPYKIIPTAAGDFSVINDRNQAIHSFHTTLDKAQAQLRLLNAINHGFVPTGIRNRL